MNAKVLVWEITSTALGADGKCGTRISGTMLESKDANLIWKAVQREREGKELKNKEQVNYMIATLKESLYKALGITGEHCTHWKIVGCEQA